jgi:hypothetical protein
LPVVLYNCKNCSFTLRKEHNEEVYEESTEDSCSNRRMEKFHNKELRNLYCLANVMQLIKSRRIRWAEYVANMLENDLQNFKRKS